MAPEHVTAPKPRLDSHDGGPEERRLVGSPHATAANAAVLALTRAARSFTLYDPANKVVRTLIADYRQKLERVLADHGPLALEVHPFELLLGTEVVYVEQDRERSLSFRLFRDGVRRIAFEPGATWEELLRLLQILSLRFTGVRQQEDDLVTLLRKAEFAHLSVAAIEGFVPEEETAEPSVEESRGTTARYEPPADWDLPLPEFGEKVPLRYRSVPDDFLERLRAEESQATQPRAAVRAVAELLQARGHADPGPVLAFATEVREFLLLEGHADLLLQLARGVAHALAKPEASQEFLAAFLDDHALRLLAQSTPPAAGDAADPLGEVLDLAPAAVQERLLGLLAEPSADARQAGRLRDLAARGYRRSPERLVERLREARGQTAAALLGVLAGIDSALALRNAMQLAGTPDVALQKESLRLLAAAPPAPDHARAVARMLESDFEEVRVAACEAVAHGGPRGFPSLRSHAEKRSASLSPAEAVALGHALVQASARDALSLFDGWLRPKSGGLMARLAGGMQAPPALQRTALAGLARLKEPPAAELIDLLAHRGEHAVAAEAAALRAQAVGGRRHE